jgi:hypothetical protein
MQQRRRAPDGRAALSTWPSRWMRQPYMHACPPPSLSPCPTRTSPLPLFSAWACRLGRGTPPPSGAGPPSSQVTRITLSPALASPCRGRCATNLSSCQCIAARAGVRTAAEPPFRLFPTPSSPPAIPSAGPALASSSGGCASGLLALVPDASALVPAAAPAQPDDPSPSPGPGAPFHSLDPLGVPPPSDLGPRGMSCSCFRAGLGWVAFSSPPPRLPPSLGGVQAVGPGLLRGLSCSSAEVV